MDFESTRSILQQISLPTKTDSKIEIFVKRDDLVDPLFGGNKFRKLRYNLSAFRESGKARIVTFGGPWSNHIAATASVCNKQSIPVLGIIRGYANSAITETLSRAKEQDMELQFADRKEYEALKKDSFYLEQRFPDYYSIPEGGANKEGAAGCAEIIDELELDFDVIACPCGSGTTLAGLASNLTPGQKAVGYSVMKGGDYLQEPINAILSQLDASQANWELVSKFHFGGFAKVNEDLVLFMREFFKSNQIKLDPVYSAKLFYGVRQDIEDGKFDGCKRIVLLHTGGLQGLKGVEQNLGYSIYN